ncbi:AbrB family transcriptional regulator [Sulfitobacter alexandrii]|uniref:AbrB family transcriptional regulator n=1 Tax=Sulfitobacter alexandrii TaxID=1917485 RepID=A0A1J0WHS5_9RHOB|nr:AbrB family transcriptional regulator [Sulfitobacter alexandrii]APE43728.1 AbrB family transcriptional regulator [Sulfitobacter alexandrii]
MRWSDTASSFQATLLTLAVGIIGAAVAWALSAPIFILLGPAVAVSLAGLAGMRSGMDSRLRDGCFVVLGIAVGAGFDQDALGAMLRWPLAFLLMACVLWLMLVLSRLILTRFFGFDPRSALLAGAPGHLSFVIAFAADSRLDVARVSIVQSVRLLALTLVVPFIPIALGVEVSGTIAQQGPGIAPGALAAVAVAAVVLGRLFARVSVPAPLLLGAMVASAAGHLSGLATGALPGWLIQPAYLVLGALIGTRFSGVTPTQLLQGLGAGLTVTAVAACVATLGAVPVALALGMPLAHVLVAFAPGGLETMIALGVVLGVVPGFVAACHIARLLVLTVLLPAMLGRSVARDLQGNAPPENGS